jgi:uncharacterized surface protein with fasciclin (FAS1) repeats
MYSRVASSIVILASLVSASTAQTIYQLANQTAAFSTLKAAIDAAGLADTLNGDGTFTVFAPVNDAFVKLDSATITKLLKPEWSHHLQDIILYHALPSVVKSTGLVDGPVVTLNGESITISVNDLTINNSSIIVGPFDVDASNGVVRK